MRLKQSEEFQFIVSLLTFGNFMDARFQASSTIKMRYDVCLDFTRRRMVTPYRRFGTCRFLLQGSSIPREDSSFFSDCLDLKMGLIACPETSVRKYCSELRKIPAEHRSQISWSFSDLRPLSSHGSDKE